MLNALSISAIIFSKKLKIKNELFFEKYLFIKLSHFSMFDSNFKWVEKQSFNFPYLACCKIELFSKKKKISEKKFLKITHTFSVD